MDGAEPTENSLALDREAMRELGYRTVDLLADWLSSTERPPLRRASPAEMVERLSGPAPERPESLEAILEGLVRDVLPFTSRGDHPAFFAFVPFAGTWPGALGDFIASACNLYAGSWMEGAGPSQVELEVLGWFKTWLGYPADAAGSLVSGGSAANMTALAVAREALAGAMRDDLVVYVSDQAHSSLARGARIVGFRPEQVRVLPTDDTFRLAARTLRTAMEVDVRAGRTPLLVSASGGATNAGTIDPLPELAEVARDHGAWLHVDAAYGGFAALTERGARALVGIELADSITLDPHKWLYQPYECGCLLVREGAKLHSAFEITPDYLRDAEAGERETNFSDLGLQLTRSSRALKLWMSLRYFGLGAFRAAIDRSLDLAEYAERRIEESPSLELSARRSLGIVCFRRRFEGATETEVERRNGALAAALEESGLGFVSSTRLHSRYALRLCVLSHTTRREDVDRVLDFLESATPELRGPETDAVRYERHPDVRQSRPDMDGDLAAAMQRQPLFAGLDERELRRAAALAERRSVETGETVVAQWAADRDFYVIVDGVADVYVDDEPVRELGPGDFFGELAALDWGAGFGYSRLASVVAGSRLELLAFRDGSLNALVGDLPQVAALIRTASNERLGRHT